MLPTPTHEARAYRLIGRRLLPLLFACYIVAYLDRVNVGFAKLGMASSLALSDAVYGFGAGVFFVGYFLFEVPSNLLLERLGARAWIARIMITWGIVSGAFAFVDVIPWGPLPALFGVERTVFGFYALRFLLGVAEAGFFPGVILYLTYWYPRAERARATAMFMSAIAVANVLGAPLSGAILEYADGWRGWEGWRWLFVLEALPSIMLGAVVLRLLPNGPRDARWLSPDERDAVAARVAADAATAGAGPSRHGVRDAFAEPRVWALALVYLAGVFSLYGVNFWMPTLVQELGVAPGDYLRVGLLTAVPWGFASLVMLVSGIHSDRTGERRWHTAGALLATAAGLLLLAASQGETMASMLALCVIAAGVLSFLATFWTIPTSLLSATAAAAGIAWINSVGNLGGHFGPDLVGRVRTATGSTSSALQALAAIAVTGAVLLLVATRAGRERASTLSEL